VNKLRLLFLCAAAGNAATVLFTGLPANTEYGTYNGFATATIDGTAGQLLICDDYSHTTYVPSGPLAYLVSSLAAPDSLDQVRFKDDAIDRYKQAALLIDRLDSSQSGLLDLTADIQYALWHLFTPSSPVTVTAQTLLAETASRVSSLNPADVDIYQRLEIYTPDITFGSNQEFLRLTPHVPLPPSIVLPPHPIATPEPGPAVLMVAGMLVMIGPLLLRRLSAQIARVKARRDNTPLASEP
jgi:hypothetical protein